MMLYRVEEETDGRHVYFDVQRISQYPLCAYCCQNNNAAMQIAVGQYNAGLAKELEGSFLHVGNLVFKWEIGKCFQVGDEMMPRLAAIFGYDACFVSGRILPMMSVTQVLGTTVCAYHSVEALQDLKYGRRYR